MRDILGRSSRIESWGIGWGVEIFQLRKTLRHVFVHTSIQAREVRYTLFDRISFNKDAYLLVSSDDSCRPLFDWIFVLHICDKCTFYIWAHTGVITDCEPT